MTEQESNPVEPAPSWFAEYRRSSHARASAALIGAELFAAAAAGAVYYVFNDTAENHYRPFIDSVAAMLPADHISRNQLDDLQAMVAKEKTDGITLDSRGRVSEMVGSYDTYSQDLMKMELRAMQESIGHKIEDSKDIAHFSLGLSVLTLALAAFAVRRSYQIGKEKLY